MPDGSNIPAWLLNADFLSLAVIPIAGWLIKVEIRLRLLEALADSVRQLVDVRIKRNR